MYKFNLNLVMLVIGCVASLKSHDKRPNIVMFLTDDQDLMLGGMTPMKNVHRYIANEGAVFVNSYVASPICCPSRATILTGMYPHNHGTRNNSIDGGCNGAAWRLVENQTFATVLKQGGYDTFYAGKYLNQYGVKAAGGPGVVPPGWSEWHGLVGNSVYYNYTLSNNGVPSFSADHYLTDTIRDLAVEYIQSRDGGGSPLLMVLAPPAPHQPFTPAPRHAGHYANVSALHTPSFNVEPVDKHWLMSMPPSPLPAYMLPHLDHVYRSRWETLLAVDEMVADVVSALDSADILSNTIIIFTSDNGYHIGQFSQVYDKRQPYETDIRVPLIIRGPGIKRKSLIHNPTVNVDLAPTIIKMAGLEVPHNMDGVPLNFSSTGLTSDFEERNMLVEYHGEGSDRSVDRSCHLPPDGTLSECAAVYACKCQDARNNTYACVRHLHPAINYKYCKFDDTEGLEEMYDLAVDPHELRNVAYEALPALRAWYRLTLARLRTCVGARECDASIAGEHV